jgi:hypothetical protein
MDETKDAYKIWQGNLLESDTWKTEEIGGWNETGSCPVADFGISGVETLGSVMKD